MNKKKLASRIQDFGALIALVLLVVVIGIISPEFRTLSNFLSLLRQSSINGFIAFGMTCVILTGGIDLSVGSVLALSTALCAGFITKGMPVGLSMILALIIGTALGAVSGLLVTKGRLQPFIATLITMTVYRGVTMIYMDGKPISNLGDSFTLKVVGKGNSPYYISLVDLMYEDESAEENERSFYNALHEEQLPNNIEIKKLRVENVVYMNFKNDFSFKTGDQVLVLGEHQSTLNNNMPLRELMYIGRVLEQLIPIKDRYRKGQVHFPTPEFYTLYNGKDFMEKEKIL